MGSLPPSYSDRGLITEGNQGCVGQHTGIQGVGGGQRIMEGFLEEAWPKHEGKGKLLSRVLLCNFIVHGILQARILEWVVIPFSRGSSQPREG